MYVFSSPVPLESVVDGAGPMVLGAGVWEQGIVLTQELANSV